MKCKRCQYSLAGLTPRIRVCPECGERIDWSGLPPVRRRKAPIVAHCLIAAPHVAVVLVGICAPRGSQYGFGVSDTAIDIVLLLWVLSPLPTIAGLWMLLDRHSFSADRTMAVTMILGTVVPLIAVPFVALVALRMP